MLVQAGHALLRALAAQLQALDADVDFFFFGGDDHVADFAVGLDGLVGFVVLGQQFGQTHFMGEVEAFQAAEIGGAFGKQKWHEDACVSPVLLDGLEGRGQLDVLDFRLNALFVQFGQLAEQD